MTMAVPRFQVRVCFWCQTSDFTIKYELIRSEKWVGNDRNVALVWLADRSVPLKDSCPVFFLFRRPARPPPPPQTDARCMVFSPCFLAVSHGAGSRFCHDVLDTHPEQAYVAAAPLSLDNKTRNENKQNHFPRLGQKRQGIKAMNLIERALVFFLLEPI